MCPPDDISKQNPPTQTERSESAEATSRRSVGPESETRGGPEATDETLDDSSRGRRRRVRTPADRRADKPSASSP